MLRQPGGLLSTAADFARGSYQTYTGAHVACKAGCMNLQTTPVAAAHASPHLSYVTLLPLTWLAAATFATHLCQADGSAPIACRSKPVAEHKYGSVITKALACQQKCTD